MNHAFPDRSSPESTPAQTLESTLIPIRVAPWETVFIPGIVMQWAFHACPVELDAARR